VTSALASSIGDRFTLLIDTLPNVLTEQVDVLLPAATWVEKAGTFENADGVLQAFERAIDPIDYTKSESQISIDLLARLEGGRPAVFNAASTRQVMAAQAALERFGGSVSLPTVPMAVESDMQLIEL
jgi:anaerobic selenocysteine-containing dehydrogenase